LDLRRVAWGVGLGAEARRAVLVFFFRIAKRNSGGLGGGSCGAYPFLSNIFLHNKFFILLV